MRSEFSVLPGARRLNEHVGTVRANLHDMPRTSSHADAISTDVVAAVEGLQDGEVLRRGHFARQREVRPSPRAASVSSANLVERRIAT